jgi:hypothetical protein
MAGRNSGGWNHVEYKEQPGSISSLHRVKKNEEVHYLGI